MPLAEQRAAPMKCSLVVAGPRLSTLSTPGNEAGVALLMDEAGSRFAMPIESRACASVILMGEGCLYLKAASMPTVGVSKV